MIDFIDLPREGKLEDEIYGYIEFNDTNYNPLFNFTIDTEVITDDILNDKLSLYKRKSLLKSFTQNLYDDMSDKLRFYNDSMKIEIEIVHDICVCFSISNNNFNAEFTTDNSEKLHKIFNDLCEKIEKCNL
jgi:hypothetical protein